jgi:excisionase family DNA binding protein
MAQKTPSDGKPEVLTPDEVAKILRVSRSKINQLVAAHEIPFVRIGKRRIRFKREAIMKWFREQHATAKRS